MTSVQRNERHAEHEVHLEWRLALGLSPVMCLPAPDYLIFVVA